MIKVVFMDNFAGYKKKEIAEFDSQLASRLIRRGKVKLYKPRKNKKEE